MGKPDGKQYKPAGFRVWKCQACKFRFNNYLRQKYGPKCPRCKSPKLKHVE